MDDRLRIPTAGCTDPFGSNAPREMGDGETLRRPYSFGVRKMPALLAFSAPQHCIWTCRIVFTGADQTAKRFTRISSFNHTHLKQNCLLRLPDPLPGCLNRMIRWCASWQLAVMSTISWSGRQRNCSIFRSGMLLICLIISNIQASWFQRFPAWASPGTPCPKQPCGPGWQRS